jgi:hypothetical protein
MQKVKENNKQYLCLFLLFITGLVRAQTDFRAGYFIDLKNDTLMGDIDYRGDVFSFLENFSKINKAIKKTQKSLPNKIWRITFAPLSTENCDLSVESCYTSFRCNANRCRRNSALLPKSRCANHVLLNCFLYG